MPVGYLVATATVAVGTLLALAPRRPGRSIARRLGFAIGLAVNELPFVAFYWLLASTVLALAQGDVDSPVGWLGLALALLATAGLVVVVRRALQTGRAVDDALREGLGSTWRAELDPGTAARLRCRLPWARILFAPLLFRRRDVERVANVRYGDAGERNLLDVYRPRSRPSGCPTLIHLHGGSFVRGRKSRQARPLLARLASQGWVCISANYRLRPAAAFPDHLIDVKKVIAWVRDNGHEHGADPAMVFVAGSSAGAHLAAFAALTQNDSVFQPGFEDADTSVAAAVCLGGYYGSLAGSDASPSSPAAYIHADAPPFFVAHGDRDKLVPLEDARSFVDALRDASARPVVYAELPGAQHSFDLFGSVRFEEVVDAVEAFAAWVTRRS